MVLSIYEKMVLSICEELRSSLVCNPAKLLFYDDELHTLIVIFAILDS